VTRKKKNPLDALMDIPEVETAIRLHLPVLIQRMFDLAEGIVWMEERTNPETKERLRRIFTNGPDRQALQFLIENVMGKTPQRVELTGKGGGPVSVIPWAPLTEMEIAGLLPSGDTVVEGVYEEVGGV